MAKTTKIEHKKEVIEDKKSSPSEKVVETTKKEVVDNLDKAKIKAEKKALEKDKARVHNIEATAAKTEENIDELIAEKKAQLEAAPVIETKVTKTVKTKEKAPKKESKWVKNPISVARNLITTAAAGLGGFASRFMANISDIVARPQQLVSKQFYKDHFTNLKNVFGAMITGVTGSVYKPHREKFKFVDTMHKSYGPEFANPTDKSAIVRGVKKAGWFAGKFIGPTMTAGTIAVAPKLFARINQGLNNFVHETLEGIRDSKFSLNRKKWGFKYNNLKESFLKAKSWNRKGKKSEKTMPFPAAQTEEKVVVEKKAA